MKKCKLVDKSHTTELHHLEKLISESEYTNTSASEPQNYKKFNNKKENKRNRVRIL